MRRQKANGGEASRQMWNSNKQKKGNEKGSTGKMHAFMETTFSLFKPVFYRFSTLMLALCHDDLIQRTTAVNIKCINFFNCLNLNSYFVVEIAFFKSHFLTRF